MDNGFDNFVGLSNSIISLNKYFLTNYGWYIIIRVIATIQPKELCPRKSKANLRLKKMPKNPIVK